MSELENLTPYSTRESQYLFKSKWRSLRQDRINIGQDREIFYTYLEVPRAVFVVPLTEDGRIVLIRQYRYPIREWVLEVPAGSIDVPGEDPALSAHRELREEVGGECRELIHLAQFYSSSAHLDLASEIYLATGVTLGQAELEETELIQRLVLPAREALALARKGKVKEGQSAYALLLAEPHILARENENWK